MSFLAKDKWEETRKATEEKKKSLIFSDLDYEGISFRKESR
jgi:hypothetical protein